MPSPQEKQEENGHWRGVGGAFGERRDGDPSVGAFCVGGRNAALF